MPACPPLEFEIRLASVVAARGLAERCLCVRPPGRFRGRHFDEHAACVKRDGRDRRPEFDERDAEVALLLRQTGKARGDR